MAIGLTTRMTPLAIFSLSSVCAFLRREVRRAVTAAAYPFQTVLT
jgi:hypothetical protein